MPEQELRPVKINYSPHAESLIKNLKDFDRAEFEAWFLLNLPIGSRNITDYIISYKEKVKKGA